MEGAITPGSTMATNRMVRNAALLSRACGVDFTFTDFGMEDSKLALKYQHRKSANEANQAQEDFLV
jgi:hypothetical protein